MGSTPDVRNTEISRWLYLHSYLIHEKDGTKVVKPGTAQMLLDEMKRTRELSKQCGDELKAEQWKDPNDGLFQNLRSPASWKWSRMGLFGNPPAHFGIGQEAIWQRKRGLIGQTFAGEYEVSRASFGSAELIRKFESEGWEIIPAMPDFTARLEALRSQLDSCYRANDVPKEVKKARRTYIDLRLALLELTEENRLLFKKVNIDSSFEPELKAFQDKKANLERGIQEQDQILRGFAIDPRYVR
jgi:hypothetical protein